MKKVDRSYQDPVFSIKELGTFLKSSWLKLIFVFFLGFTFFGLFFYCMPQKVSLKASYRDVSEKASPTALIEEAFSEIGVGQKAGEGLVLMKSDLLLKPIIQKYGFQAKTRLDPVTKYFCNNIKTHLNREIFRKNFSLNDRNVLLLKDLHYEGAEKLYFFISFENDQDFVLLDSKKRFIQRGKVGQPLSRGKVRFVVDSSHFGQTFSLVVEPWSQTVKKLQKNLLFKQQKKCKTHVQIFFKDISYTRGKGFLDDLIDGYLRFLQAENFSYSQSQLSFLDKRKVDLFSLIEKNLNDYANWMEKHLQEEGVVEVKEAMEKFGRFRSQYTAKISNLENQQQKFPSNLKSLIAFAPNNLEKKKQRTLDIEDKIDSIEKQLNEDNWHLAKDGVFGPELQRLSFQWQQLQEEKTTIQNWQLPNKKDFSKNISIKKIQKKHPQWKSLSLEMAKELYISYQRKQDELKEKKSLLQNFYQNSHLEKDSQMIGSYTTFLQDPISQKTIDRVVELNQKITQELYITEKEKERWQEEISHHIVFLKKHVHRLMTYTQTHLSNIEKKVPIIKGIALYRIDEKTASAKEQIDSYFTTTANALEKEKLFWQDKLISLEEKSKEIPNLWKEEKALQLESEMNLSRIGFLTQLIESKILSQQISQNKARAIDYSSSIWKSEFSLVGLALALSFMLTIGYFLLIFVKASIKGAILSEEDLIAAGLKVFSKKKLHSATQAAARECIKQKNGSLSLVLGLVALPEKFTTGLAEIFFRRKEKVLLVYCDQISKKEIGFYQYMQKQVSIVPIQSTESYDLLFAGVELNHKSDILLSEDFLRMIEELKISYDWIMLITNNHLSHPMSVHMIDVVDRICVSLKKAAIADLRPYWMEGASYENEIKEALFLL